MFPRNSNYPFGKKKKKKRCKIKKEEMKTEAGRQTKKNAWIICASVGVSQKIVRLFTAKFNVWGRFSTNELSVGLSFPSGKKKKEGM